MHGYTEPRVCRIKKGLSGEYTKGVCFGYLNLASCWAIVQWESYNYPATILASALELQETTWVPMK